MYSRKAAGTYMSVNVLIEAHWSRECCMQYLELLQLLVSHTGELERAESLALLGQSKEGGSLGHPLGCVLYTRHDLRYVDAWMDGCMDAWMHGCMEGWAYG